MNNRNNLYLWLRIVNKYLNNLPYDTKSIDFLLSLIICVQTRGSDSQFLNYLKISLAKKIKGGKNSRTIFRVLTVCKNCKILKLTSKDIKSVI